MKLITPSVVWIILMSLVLSNKSIQRPQQIAPSKDCITSMLSNKRSLVDSIQHYLKYVGNYEIPIIAQQTSGDTTHYFISAFIATYMIKQNPPTAVVMVNNREVLLYLGKGSIAQTSPACYDYVIKKYSRLLHIDKINRREGRSPSYKNKGFNYDPIMGDIAITKDGQIITKHADKIPFIRYD